MGHERIKELLAQYASTEIPQYEPPALTDDQRARLQSGGWPVHIHTKEESHEVPNAAA